MPSTQVRRKLAFIGGTGWMGYAMVLAHARAGHSVIVGERDAAAAQAGVQKLLEQLAKEGRALKPGQQVVGMENVEAAAAADVVFLVYGLYLMEDGNISAHQDDAESELAARSATFKLLLPNLVNKVVIDCTNIGYMHLEDHWGQESSMLRFIDDAGDVPIQWACAWKHVFAPLVERGGDPQNPMSVLVCGDDSAKATAMQLINSLGGGFKALDAGGRAESKKLEIISPQWMIMLKKKNFADDEWPAWRWGV